MDEHLRTQLGSNSLRYKRCLDRITEKYSKLQYQDGGIEVDLHNTSAQTIERYMRQSKAELSKLESKSLLDLRDESLRAQDVTIDSQCDFTHQAGGADDTCVSSISSTQFSVEDDGLARSDVTQLTTSSLDESQRNLSETELQPEDQDKQLEMSLRSHGCSFVELYPSMISRIERAWHRQHVSEAADSVLRRYRRWRQQPNRSHLSNTFTVTLRPGRPKWTTGKTMFKETDNSPVKIQVMGTDATPRSPLQLLNNLQDWQGQQQHSPGRVRSVLAREQHPPILVMDLSGSSETSVPKEVSLNETFNMSQLREQPSTYAVNPSRPFYPTAKTSLDVSLRSKRLSPAGHMMQCDGASAYASQTTSVKDKPDIYGSPVRQRMMSSLSISPQTFSRSPKKHSVENFSRSPKKHSVENFSREPFRPRSMSDSLPSLPQKPTVQLKMIYPQDSHQPPLLPQLPSPQSATAAKSRHRLRRHLSFDSCLPSIRVSCSPKQLDEDFIKLYHKFVCQNKSSSFNGPPCRFCARNTDATRGHSSSALAALALSPQRSILRKRHRELSWNSHPQSKRFRDSYCTSSPGSKRHGNEMLRRRLTVSECERSHSGLSYSSGKYSMFPRWSSQQHSVDAPQETWRSRGRDTPAAEFCSMSEPSL